VLFTDASVSAMSDEEDERKDRAAARRWEKRAKMRRVLSEVKLEHDSQQGFAGPSLQRQHHSSLLDDDEESQTMLRVLKVVDDENLV
jgi:hypothetical protein